MTSPLGVVGWLAVLMGPGLLLARLLARGAGWWWSLAAAPAASLGLLYLVMKGASALGVDPALAGAVLVAGSIVAGLALSGVSAAARRRSGDPVVGLRAWRTRVGLAEVVSVTLLGVAIVAGVWLWLALHAPFTVPAGWDAMHHGFFVRQILEHGTLGPDVLLSSDAYGSDAGSTFYPIAVDGATAALHDLTGLRVSTLLLTSTVVACGVVLPLGTFVLARALLRPGSVLPGVAALASLLPAVTYGIERAGRPNVLVALALVPGLVAALQPGTWRPRWSTLPVAGLAALGMLAAHTSELLTAGVLLGLSVLVLAVLDRTGIGLLRWSVWGGSALLGAVALMLVADRAILGSAGERTGAIQPMTSGAWSLSRAWLSVVGVHEGADGFGRVDVVMVLALAGCVLTVLRGRRRLIGPALALLAVVGLYVALATGRQTWLATPWYAESARVFWNVVPLLAIPAAITLVAVAEVAAALVVRLSRAREPGRAATVRIAVTAGFALAATVALVPPVGSIGRSVVAAAGPVDGDSVAAFRYLERHVPEGSRVFDDLRADGAMWMYADQAVPTLFGNAPYLGGAPESWHEKLWLRNHLVTDAPDEVACVEHLLARWHVSYVYYGARTLVDGVRHMTLEQLQASPLLEEAFRSGGTHVFRVVPPTTSPECTLDVTAGTPWETNGQ